MTREPAPARDPDSPPPPDPTVPTSERLRKGFARARWRRLVRVGGGVVMLVLGVLGLFLPFLQGVLFLAIGAALLAPDVPLARRVLVAAYRRWPRVRRAVPRRFRRVGRDEGIPPAQASDDGPEAPAG